MCMVDIQSAIAEIRGGKNEEIRKKQDKNIMSASAMQGSHNQHSDDKCHKISQNELGLIKFCAVSI